jgi:hypothetical protein
LNQQTKLDRDGDERPIIALTQPLRHRVFTPVTGCHWVSLGVLKWTRRGASYRVCCSGVKNCRVAAWRRYAAAVFSSIPFFSAINFCKSCRVIRYPERPLKSSAASSLRLMYRRIVSSSSFSSFATSLTVSQSVCSGISSLPSIISMHANYKPFDATCQNSCPLGLTIRFFFVYTKSYQDDSSILLV